MIANLEDRKSLDYGYLIIGQSNRLKVPGLTFKFHQNLPFNFRFRNDVFNKLNLFKMGCVKSAKV